MSNKRAKTTLMVLLTAMFIGFIFFNSMQDGDTSSQASGIITTTLENIVKFVFPSFTLEGGIIRKAAHFTEFFVLSMLLLPTLSLLGVRSKYILAMYIALVVAVADETIQLYTPGRASQVADVLLDISGAYVSIIFIYIYKALKPTKKRKKN